MKRIDKSFFDYTTLKIARSLLGQVLIRKTRDGVMMVKIVETEAYTGPKDLASHASRGRTKRTEIMYGPPGHAYIYQIYGLYFCLNVVCGNAGIPHAVLIRAGEPLLGVMGKTSGPGLLCKAMGINKGLNGINLLNDEELYLAYGDDIPQNKIVTATRVGIDYAKEYRDKKWRFYIKDNLYISKA